MAQLSLLKMLDHAFSAPTFECFNYRVLHSLLRSMLGYLRMQDLPTLEEGQDPALLLGGHLPTEEHPGEVEALVGDLGTGHELLAPRKDQGVAGSSQIAGVAADVAADVQQLKNKIEENESGVTQAMVLSQDLLQEVGGIKVAQSQMAEEVRKIQEALALGGLAPALEGPGRQPGSLGLQAGVRGASVAPEQRAGAASGWPGTSDADATSTEMRPRSPGVKTTTPESPTGTSCTQTSTLGMQPQFPGIQTTTLRVQPAQPGTVEEGAVARPSHPDAEPDLPPREAKVLAEATPGALATQRDARSTQLPQAEQAAAGSLCVETEEGLPQIGQLGHLYAALKEQVSHLAATKLDRSELEKLHQPTPEKDLESITSILADLQGHVSSLSRDLQREQEKIRQLEGVMAKLGSAGEDRRMDGRDQITGQLGSVLQEIKNELKELGEQHMKTEATLQRVVAKEAQQQQQEQLRVIVESTEQEPAEAQPSCPICSRDIGPQVELLLQRYEKLQELVDYLMSRPTVGKAVRQLPERSQDRELLRSFQATVVEMQADYTKIRSVTDTLLGDLHQKERDLEALFQSVERLQKEKADKEELSLKANRSALASKVSRAQFEAWMEQLNEGIQETMSRVTGLEQGSTQVQQQLRKGMDSKLDRVELEPFRQELEERWKRSLEQLQEKVLMTAAGDDAAGLKKQLLEHFHCVSCDRPVDTLVPGPKIASIPTMPALPPRFAGHPPTIIELEQHGHREQADKCRYPSVSPQCGGLRTVTQPLQRFQPAPPSTPRQRPPRTLPPVKAGIVENARELLAQDGHIYRDQTEGQPPALISEEGFSRHQPKLSPRPLGPRDAGRLLLRPRSAGSFRSQPGTDASSHSHLLEAPGLLQVQRAGSSSPQDGGPAVKPLSP